MKKLQCTVNRIVAKKKLDKHALGAIAINEVRRFFFGKSTDGSGKILGEEEITGYVKFSKIIVKTANQELKIQLFLQKQAVLLVVNKKLALLGISQRMQDIRIK